MKMKVVLLLGILLLAVTVSAQEQRPLRGRIRSLIKAARGGDLEARETLKSLRERLLKSRKANGRRSKSQRLPEPALTETKAPKAPVEPPTPIEFQAPIKQQPNPDISSSQIKSEPVRVRLQSTQPQRRPRVQQIQRQPDPDFEPHRAVQRGLEVDSRSELFSNIRVTNRTKTPPIQTIRRYSYFDEDGSYVFGYEAEDGSFKEERRGLDCVVNGKYGYVDPSGIRREYTYISGNKCDPNAVNAEENTIDQAPPNDQFQRETAARKLTEQEMGEFRVNLGAARIPQARRQNTVSRQSQSTARAPQPRRQPVQRRPAPQQSIPANRFRVRKPAPSSNGVLPPFPGKDETNQPSEAPIESSVLPPFQSQAQAPSKPADPIQPPQFKESEIQKPKTIPIPKPQTTPIPRPPPPPPPPKQVLRPQPIGFDFDQEFKNIFSFGSQARAPPPQVFKQPLPPPRPHTNQIPPIPQTKPKHQSLQPNPLPPLPVQQPSPKSNFASTTSSGHHQLVFDSATGTFKTVPLGSVNNFNTFNPAPSAGRPLPVGRPLPSASLSGRTGSTKTQAEINSLLSHFRIQV